MKYTLLTSVLLATLSTTAVAGVKDKKAIRAADAKVAEQVIKTQKDCGIAKLDVVIAWDKFKKMAADNKAVFEEKRYQKQWLMSHAGDRTASVLEAMGQICKDDADYKEEIALLTNIVVEPQAKLSDYRSSFVLDGTTIKVTSGHYMTRRASDYTKPIKALY